MKFFPVVEASGSCALVRRVPLIRWIVMRLSLIYVLITVTAFLAEARDGYAQILDQRVSVGMNDELLPILLQIPPQRHHLYCACRGFHAFVTVFTTGTITRLFDIFCGEDSENNRNRILDV